MFPPFVDRLGKHIIEVGGNVAFIAAWNNDNAKMCVHCPSDGYNFVFVATQSAVKKVRVKGKWLKASGLTSPCFLGAPLYVGSVKERTLKAGASMGACTHNAIENVTRMKVVVSMAFSLHVHNSYTPKLCL